MAGLYLKNLI